MNFVTPYSGLRHLASHGRLERLPAGPRAGLTRRSWRPCRCRDFKVQVTPPSRDTVPPHRDRDSESPGPGQPVTELGQTPAVKPRRPDALRPDSDFDCSKCRNGWRPQVLANFPLRTRKLEWEKSSKLMMRRFKNFLSSLNLKISFIALCAICSLFGVFRVNLPFSSETCNNDDTVFDSLRNADSLARIYDFPKMESDINFNDKADTFCRTTWVTALYGIESLNCAQNSLCQQLLEKFVKVDKCSIVFTDHEKPMDRVASSKIKWIPIAAHISSMRADLSLHWNHYFEGGVHRSPQEAYHRQWIKNLKPWFLDISARMNPFESTAFFWVDIDAFSDIDSHTDMLNFLPMMKSSSIYFVNLNPFSSGELFVEESKSWMQSYCRKVQSQHPSCFVESPRECEKKISGVVFGGHAPSLIHWRKAYYSSLQKLIANNWYIGNHENVIISACFEDPKVCSLVISDCQHGSPTLRCLLGSFQSQATRNSFHLKPILSQKESWVAIEIGGQLGNQMFMLASSFGIAQSRKAKWCVSNLKNSPYIKHFTWLTEPLQCPGFSLKIFNLTGDSTFFVISNVFVAANEGVGFAKYTPSILTSTDENIFVGLFLQSFKYFQQSGLPFVLNTQRSAERWVETNKVQVGIHVRRGDKHTDTGNVVTPLRYFYMAISKMREIHGAELAFVVCTDDADWVKQQEPFHGMQVLSTHNPAFDMAVLAACQHHIMSIGTYGWWGTYLGDSPNSTNIYPVLQFTVPLIRGFSHKDYFPPNWIPIDYEVDDSVDSTFDAK